MRIELCQKVDMRCHNGQGKVLAGRAGLYATVLGDKGIVVLLCNKDFLNHKSQRQWLCADMRRRSCLDAGFEDPGSAEKSRLLTMQMISM